MLIRGLQSVSVGLGYWLHVYRFVADTELHAGRSEELFAREDRDGSRSSFGEEVVKHAA